MDLNQKIEKEANIDAVVTALVAYYKDALAKEAQVTKATATKGSDTKKSLLG